MLKKSKGCSKQEMKGMRTEYVVPLMNFFTPEFKINLISRLIFIVPSRRWAIIWTEEHRTE